jgi:hypothetical protein
VLKEQLHLGLLFQSERLLLVQGQRTSVELRLSLGMLGGLGAYLRLNE